MRTQSDPRRAALHAHSEAINARDMASYRTTMHFPFTYQNYDGIAHTWDGPRELSEHDSPWEIILSTDPHWSHTEFDVVDEVAGSCTSAVYKVRFRRIDTKGKSSGPWEAIWIATRRDGRWAIQFRHNLGQWEGDELA